MRVVAVIRIGGGQVVVVVAVAQLLVFSAGAVAGTGHTKPKLVLQITIDQMRGDCLSFPLLFLLQI